MLEHHRVRIADSGMGRGCSVLIQQAFLSIPGRYEAKTLNFYRRFPGDYARDTKHLTLAEHGAYTLLLDYYYSTEKPIPSLKLACAICNARTGGEVKVVKKVLAYFFKQRGKGWVNNRAEVELSHANDKRKAAQNSAKQRWHRSDGNANASETQYENRTTQHGFRNAPRLQTPDTINPDRSAAGVNGEMKKAAAAAFIDIGFEKPFGRPNFQAIWITHFVSARMMGTWVTQAMEDTIQECQKANIGIPPQFYEAKHDVEVWETNARKPLKEKGEE